MNILYLTNLMAVGGGVEKCIYMLCKRFHKQHNIYVCSTGGSYIGELDAFGIKHFTIKNPSSKNPIVFIKNLTALLYITKKYSINIIHSHHRMTTAYSRIISLMTGVKIIHTAHLYTCDKIVITNLVLRNIPVIAVSEGVKNNLIKRYKLKNDCVRTVYNTIDLENQGALPVDIHLIKAKKKNQFCIGAISRLEPVKGIDIILKAAAKVINTHDDIMFFILGDGSLKNDLLGYVKENSLGEHIHFLGVKNNIIDYIKSFDILVQSSFQEGLPLALIEALSQGLPIIGTDIPGTDEVVIHNFNGILIPPGNADELEKAILKIKENPAFHSALKDNAKISFSGKFDKENYFSKHLSVYLSLLGPCEHACMHDRLQG
jgi:glycosyltransferase involved in cell wall biosynthesis